MKIRRNSKKKHYPILIGNPIIVSLAWPEPFSNRALSIRDDKRPATRDYIIVTYTGYLFLIVTGLAQTFFVSTDTLVPHHIASLDSRSFLIKESKFHFRFLRDLHYSIIALAQLLLLLLLLISKALQGQHANDYNYT